MSHMSATAVHFPGDEVCAVCLIMRNPDDPFRLLLTCIVPRFGLYSGGFYSGKVI